MHRRTSNNPIIMIMIIVVVVDVIVEIVQEIHYPLNNQSSWRYNKTSTLIWSLGRLDADAEIAVIRLRFDYYRRIWN